jgi:hypothetical protein
MIARLNVWTQGWMSHRAVENFCVGRYVPRIRNQTRVVSAIACSQQLAAFPEVISCGRDGSSRDWRFAGGYRDWPMAFASK